jgi:hypothetical protein
MATETQVQQFVHRLEEGGWVKWVQLAALLAVCVAAYVMFIFDPMYMGLFKGLSHPKGMEQAQIAREIARGHGFTTKMIRPAVLGQFKQMTGHMPVDALPDTYHAPLWPAVLSPFLRMIKGTWVMTTKDYVYASDRMIAGVSAAFFLLAAVINYFTIRRLFDHQLAILSIGLVLICDTFWKFSLSGLPQSMLLFLFSGAAYALVRAVEQQLEGTYPLRWLIFASVLFGLLALGHAVTLWVFLGALFFCAIYFRPWSKTLAMMVGVVALVYTPWLARNHHVAGTALGAAPYSIMYQLRGTESSIMRDVEFKTDGLSPTMFRSKVQNGISDQIGRLFDLLGRIVVAPIFFLALMHPFKGRAPSVFRWALLSMWVFAVFGMALLGADEDPGNLPANNIHLFFITLFTAYGFALVLVMWMRLEINVSLVQKAFITLIYLVSSFPFLNTLTNSAKGVVQWPPYVPPFIGILNTWTNEQEIIASDMPWAVAWYADRKSLWLPMSLQDFIDLNDYERLGGRIVGLYLTPYTGNRSLVSDIVKGEYKEWAPFILRSVNAKDFPLRAATALPIDNQCIFYADHDRWSERLD